MSYGLLHVHESTKASTQVFSFFLWRISKISSRIFQSTENWQISSAVKTNSFSGTSSINLAVSWCCSSNFFWTFSISSLWVSITCSLSTLSDFEEKLQISHFWFIGLSSSSVKALSSNSLLFSTSPVLPLSTRFASFFWALFRCFFRG